MSCLKTDSIVMRIPSCYMRTFPTANFEFDYKKRCWYWRIARLAFRWLQRTKFLTDHFGKEMMYEEQAIIDPLKAVDEIVMMASEQLRNFNGVRVTKVLMGRKEFDRLLSSPLSTRLLRPVSFEVQLKEQVEYRAGPPHYRDFSVGLNLYSAKVEVIPWMEGILVL